MSNGIRLAGICCSIIGFAVAFIIAPNIPQAWGPFIVIFGVLLGVPLAVSKIRQKLRHKIDEGMEFTWNEWHAMISGWGDGVSFNKSERIPNINEIPENPRDDDFHAIIAMEAWYYKTGVALGRLTWGLIIASVILKITGVL